MRVIKKMFLEWGKNLKSFFIWKYTKVNFFKKINNNILKRSETKKKFKKKKRNF